MERKRLVPFILLALLSTAILFVPSTAATATELASINSADTAWMLVAAGLVLLMTPGLSFFYGGMVSFRNVVSTMLQSFISLGVVSILWVAVGFSLAFGDSLGGIIGHPGTFLFFRGVGLGTHAGLAPTIPLLLFALFQLKFAIITPALITGAFAERMKFGGLMLFMALWSLLVYVPVAHWVWEPGGWLAAMGAQDFAGGTVVHINAGAAGLMCAFMLGKRHNYGREPFFPNNLGYTMIGASLLWVGWFGFNAGSAVASDGRAGMAMLVTQIATAMASLTWMAVEWIQRSRVSLLGACSGAVAGLVAITPASGFVGVSGAYVIGMAAGICCYWGATGLKRMLGADDSLDVFGIHGIGGIVGALLTGIFSVKEIAGAPASLWVQTIGAFSTLAYSCVVTLIILFVVDKLVGLRVEVEHEQVGLDLSQHGEQVP